MKKQLNGYKLTELLKRARAKTTINATEQALYHELISICNEAGWIDSFQASNDELIRALRITEKTLINCRVTLINAGLIGYESAKSKIKYGDYWFPLLASARQSDDGLEQPEFNKWDIEKGTVAEARRLFDNNREQLRLKLYETHGEMCNSCRCSDNLTVDHIVPLAKGGTNDLTNLQILCKSCNSKKGTN